jgi:uncharacterized protein YbbC (DUF1343 family)
MKIVIWLFCLILFSCAHRLKLGNENKDKYLPLIKNKNIALVVNQTSLVGKEHLVDYLLRKNINVRKIFALEHGIRGNKSAGQKFNDSKDPKTGVEIISLYGNKKSPNEEDLKDIDIVIYDIQDVGVRFYTYIASLGKLMNACAQYDCQVMVLDRPNPNNYIAGPINTYKNFLAPYPIPTVYGLTIGELAIMINNEGWIDNKVNLKVIKMDNYKRNISYALSTNPSPNLRSMKAIHNYPSLALFEATSISIGRGTLNPFEIIGHPDVKNRYFSFKPKSLKGISQWPKHENRTCYGERVTIGKKLDYGLFIKYRDKISDFITDKKFLNYLVGDPQFVDHLLKAKNNKELINLWNKKLNLYINLRKKYLLY